MIINNALKLAIYDKETFTISCYIERPTYVEYSATFNSGGTFKVVAQLTEQNAQCIKKNDFINIEGDVIGVIGYIHMSSESTLTLGGTLGDRLIEQRAILEATTLINQPPYQFIQTAYQTVNTASALPRMSFVNQTFPTAQDYLSGDVPQENFLSYVQKFCQEYDLGYKIILNNSNPFALSFVLYEGTDKTDSVVISKHYESVSDFEYTLSSQDVVNFVHVVGQNNISVNVTTTPEPTGWERCDYYLDCTGIEQEGTEVEYRALLTQKGQEIINQHQLRETYSGSYTGLTFVYGTDYSLGDTVTVNDDELSIETQQIVTSFTKQIDSSGVYTKLDFGEVQKTISGVTSQLVKRVEKVENYENTINTSGGSSGGVGEDLGNGNERFNDYKNNIISGGSYNTVRGSYNTITNASNNTVGGNHNQITGYVSPGNNVSGSYNTVTNSACNIVGGRDNSIDHGGESILAGSENTGSFTDGLAVGSENELHTIRSMTAGQNNYHDDVNGIMIGSNNKNMAQPENEFTCGNHNTNRLSDSMMCGQYGDNQSNLIAAAYGWGGNPLFIFRVHTTGNVYATGSYNTSGADYAEYFEWADGNLGNEDRRGLLVRLEGDKIVLADSDDILGAVSSRPSVIGNSCEDHWNGKYKKDIFGKYIFDKSNKLVLSEEYEPNKEYIPRSERPEWAAVGLVGRLVVCDNGQCLVGECVSAKDGIAIPAQNRTNVQMLKRIDDMHIEVLIK